jgi:phage tail sheath protein FI
MTTLGVTVTTRTAPPATGAPTDTGTAFLAGPVDTANAGGPYLIRSLSDFVTRFADRTTNNAKTYDWLDTFFREGGRRAYVAGWDFSGGTLATALALLADPQLGPGQLADASGGLTPSAVIYGALNTAAKNAGRVALLDVQSGATNAQFLADAGFARAAVDNEYGALFGPWQNVPAPAGVTGGTARTVPASAVVAGLIARADALGNPNRAAAGRDFPLQYVTSPTLTLTAAQVDALSAAGGNTLLTKYGVLQNYGFQTGIAQSDITPFWQFNASRARMYLQAQAQRVGENYLFKPIDAQGKLANALKTDLDAVCMALYQADGLYGETPAEAFHNEVGAAVNTISDVAQGVLNAVCEARFSLHTRSVQIQLVSVPVTGAVSGA